MKFRERWIKEKNALPLMRKGYSRKMAVTWFDKTQSDFRRYEKKYGRKKLEELHKRGYLVSSLRRYDLDNYSKREYITDFDYLRIQPFNNSFTKWIEDILTVGRRLKPWEEHCRTVYYSLVKRNSKLLILKNPQDEKKYLVGDLVQTVKEHGPLELRPSYWASKKPRYTISCDEEGVIRVNGKVMSERSLRKILWDVPANYVLAEKVSLNHAFSESFSCDHSIKLWLANDNAEGDVILCAVMNLFWNDPVSKKRMSKAILLDMESGQFEFEDQIYTLENWEQIKERVRLISKELNELTFFTATIALQEDVLFRFLHFSGSPLLPDLAFGDELNDYLKAKAARKSKSAKITLKQRFKTMDNILFEKFVRKHCRPGIRPYMQRLWIQSVWSDFLHTRNVSLPKKIWAWKRGFLSYRHYQYGLTKDNYTNFLSDYDYHYLNRINGDYQKWINDKTTTRYILEPFKEHVPGYHFCFFKRNGQTEISRMWDCPEHIEPTFEGVLQLIRERKILAMKPSAGTHGDGFYCLTFEEGKYFVNGEEYEAQQLIDLIKSFTSFYLLTEYIHMHSQLKQIYGKSVNTIRIMVCNPEGHNPKIMQSYMRIGSERTGYTDNVGYGGICVMVNRETGELFKPETIKDHKFYDCPNHPDTGTPIAGFLPNWDFVCQRVLEISRYLGELEYLGYDIAITEDGFNLLEINIHQDLHKVATYDEEIMDFFRSKLARKMKNNNIWRPAK